MSWPWGELGLDCPASLEEVRQAYAHRLKQTHPEEDPEGFQRLHAAYQEARRLARQAQGKGRQPLEPPAPAPRPGPSEKPESRPPRPEGPSQPDGEAQQPEKEAGQPQPFQFENLLQHQKAPEPPPSRPEPPEQWDFGRLFQEAEAQREQADRKKYGNQGWVVGQALELVRLLLQDNLPRTNWERFLASRLFFQAKEDPAFIAGLAEAFRTWPVHNPQIRVELLRAYGLFQQTEVPSDYQDLYWALHGRQGPPGQAEKAEKRRSIIKVSLFVLAALGMLLAFHLGAALLERPRVQQVETICQYLEEDFGFSVESLYLITGDESYLDYYQLPERQQLTFSARPQGERAPGLGELGYETDLGNALMTQALEQLAAQWKDDCTLERFLEDGTPALSTQTPATYRFKVDLQGADGFIEALGEEMDRLRQETWFTLLRPAFQLRLSVGVVYFFTYTAPDEPFDGQELLAYYQDNLTGDLVEYMVVESGLAELDFGDAPYWFFDVGEVAVGGEDIYFSVGGVEAETGIIRRIYLYNGGYLISTPADTFNPEMDRLEYAHFRGGERVEKPDFHSPWPSIGIYRH